MKCDKRMVLLYAVTDRAWTGKQNLYEQVEAALKGGVTCVQLREKELDEESFLKEAIEISELCRRYGVPFFINDNVVIDIFFTNFFLSCFYSYFNYFFIFSITIS